MQPQQAILVNGVRLAREMIKRVLERYPEIGAIREVEDLQELALVMVESKATWAFVLLLPDQDIPEKLKFELFVKYPALRIIGIWIDGSHVRMEWQGHGHRELTSPTLDELIRLLKDEIPKNLSDSDPHTDRRDD